MAVVWGRREGTQVPDSAIGRQKIFLTEKMQTVFTYTLRPVILARSLCTG